jgi:hypothetical protein
MKGMSGAIVAFCWTGDTDSASRASTGDWAVVTFIDSDRLLVTFIDSDRLRVRSL